MDPDQTAPVIWVHTVCNYDLKSQADDKADDSCSKDGSSTTNIEIISSSEPMAQDELL